MDQRELFLDKLIEMPPSALNFTAISVIYELKTPGDNVRTANKLGRWNAEVAVPAYEHLKSLVDAGHPKFGSFTINPMAMHQFTQAMSIFKDCDRCVPHLKSVGRTRLIISPSFTGSMPLRDKTDAPDSYCLNLAVEAAKELPDQPQSIDPNSRIVIHKGKFRLVIAK